jgi:hypothetical protein
MKLTTQSVLINNLSTNTTPGREECSIEELSPTDSFSIIGGALKFPLLWPDNTPPFDALGIVLTHVCDFIDQCVPDLPLGLGLAGIIANGAGANNLLADIAANANNLSVSGAFAGALAGP